MTAIRKQIQIDAPARAVWRALTTAEGVASWWSDDARVDARVGGRMVLSFGAGDEAQQLRGVFHKVKPTRVIELKFDPTGTVTSRGARLQFNLGRGDGEVRLHVVLSGGEGIAEDDEAREAASDAWEKRLLKLRDTLEG
jgi:uncharacterized protein YndB with AHSA1/START domain